MALIAAQLNAEIIQCSDRYILSLSLPPTFIPPSPPPLFSPSLISLMVSVDVKHHAYLLTYVKIRRTVLYVWSIYYRVSHHELSAVTYSYHKVREKQLVTFARSYRPGNIFKRREGKGEVAFLFVANNICLSFNHLEKE